MRAFEFIAVSILLVFAGCSRKDSAMAEHHTQNPRRMIEHWNLADVESVHRQHPDTFHLPSLEERRSLTVGRRVRLHFAFDKPAQDGCRAERMWVTISEKQGDQFRGLLENEPVYIKGLSAGASVAFNVSNIARILIPKTDPQWFDTTKTAMVSKRVFDVRKVGFLDREKPLNDQDSGWAVWVGDESDDFAENSKNFQMVSLERLLEIDDSIESLLKAEVGAVYERRAPAQEFQRVHDWKPPEE